jgi:MFS family permease
VRAIRGALSRRGVRLLLAAGLVSLTGDWVLRVGLAYYVYVLTGSTSASALVLLASFVPQIAFGSVAGVFVDRWDRRRTMIAADLALAVGLLPLLAVRHAGQMWLVYVVLAWESIVQQFFAPAEQAALVVVADDEHLPTANALAGQNRDVSRLIGSAVGGILAAAGGIAPLVLADVASFVLSAALVARIHLPRTTDVAPDPAEPRAWSGTPRSESLASLRSRIAQLRIEWTEGVRICTREHVLRAVLVFLLITSFGEGVMGTLFAPFVRSVLHGSGSAYGLIVSAQAIGGIAGGLVAASLGTRLNAARSLGCAAVVFGAVDLAMFLYPLAWHAIWPAAILIACAGVPGAFIFAAAMTLLQRHSSDEHRGRVWGALGAGEGIAVVAGTLAAGFAAAWLGIVSLLVIQGLGYAVAGILVLFLLRPRRSATEAITPGDDRAVATHLTGYGRAESQHA